MQRTKKALASFTIVGMTLSMQQYNAFAADTVPTRLAGITAAQTAAAIADQTGWSGTAVLASSTSYGMSDALAAGPLATYLKAPILLTGAGSSLDADTKIELTKLNVKTIYVVSGTAVIHQGVLNQLVDMGITVVPLGGVDRAETSVNIANKMVGVTKVAIANGLQDALSIMAIASAANQPILYTNKDSVPSTVSAYIAANPSIVNSDVIGGTKIISDAVKAKFPGVTRHAGNSAYDTNNQVIQDFNSSLKYNKVYVANGVNGIDALASAPLAAQTNSPIVLTDGSLPAAATFLHDKLAADGVVTALGKTAVVPEAIRTGLFGSSVNNSVNPPSSPLSVTSVNVVGADRFKVVFSQELSDPSKITFNVSRSSRQVPVSVTWNSAKTEATLTNSANFPEGSYSVSVENDGTELSTSEVVVTPLRVAKLSITSDKLSITNETSTKTQTGYATYKALDQYENDITSSYLTNSFVFQSGVGSVTASDGLLTLTPADSINLIQLPSIVITGYDSTSGISINATLDTSTALGTLSDITLHKLTNINDIVLTSGETSHIWYIDYTAYDNSGNETTSYDLIKSGLIKNESDYLTTSSSYVTAQIIQDPRDSKKAAIKVAVIGNKTYIDIPVTITAMTYTGKVSSLNLTLRKASAVDTFVIKAPAYNIAINETKEIPFEAYDQNGGSLTKFSDLEGITLTGATLSANVDGTAVLKNIPKTIEGPTVITALTPSHNYSFKTFNILKAVYAKTLALSSSDLTRPVQAGDIRRLDFGYDWGGLSVKDQYDRLIDMTGGTDTYRVQATSNNPAVVSVAGIAKVGQNQILITAVAPGTATVTLELVSNENPSAVIDSKSTTLLVLKDDEIKGYVMDKVSNPLYAGTDLSNITGRDSDYEANPIVYGTTVSGTKVELVGTPIVGATLDNTQDFALAGSVGAYDSVIVYAGKLAANVTESTTNLTVMILGNDGIIHSLNTPIKSTNAMPVANSIHMNIDPTDSVKGVSLDPDGNTLRVSIASGALAPNKVMQRFDANGSSSNRAEVYFYAYDQYSSGIKLGRIFKVDSSSTLSDAQFDVTSDGTIIGTGPVVGGTVTLTGVTSNGLLKTIKVIFSE